VEEKNSSSIDSKQIHTGDGMRFGRRTVLGMILMLLGMAAMQFGSMAGAFLLPPKRKDGFGGLIDAGLLDDIPQPGMVPRLVSAGRFWLVHGESGIMALRHACTHLECLFHWDEDKRLFVCPCHGSEFSLDGRVLRGPADRNLERFPLQLIAPGGQLLRATDIDTGAAIPVADLLAAGAAPASPAMKNGESQGIRLQVDTGTRIAMAQAD
jgi:Rieske Fe-S protein